VLREHDGRRPGQSCQQNIHEGYLSWVLEARDSRLVETRSSIVFRPIGSDRQGHIERAYPGDMVGFAAREVNDEDHTRVSLVEFRRVGAGQMQEAESDTWLSSFAATRYATRLRHGADRPTTKRHTHSTCKEI